jgi:glycosyltransferase involved in cell wall biosynthesis
MLEGKSGEDALLGPSGITTPVASPDAIAAAIVALASDPQRSAQMARAGVQRVERYYRLDHIFAAYRQLYRDLAQARVTA